MTAARLPAGAVRLVGAAAVTLALATGPSAVAAPPPAAGLPPKPPMELPGAAAAAASGDGWIVAGRPGPATNRIARRHGARAMLPEGGVFTVSRARARPFASALRAAGRLAFAEPNARVARAAFPSDPLTPNQWWLPTVVDPALTPPPVTGQSPRLGVVDAQPDLDHPDLRRGNVRTTGSGPITEVHGTAVAGIAAAAANGTGIVGVWPGMRVLVSPDDQTCGSVVRALHRLIDAGVSVINMSYGFEEGVCYSHLIATQIAFGRGIVPVASGGNEFQNGNVPIRPAVDPHVVSVAATDRRNRSAYFSNANDAMDLSAPGTQVLTTVPRRLDSDGDGYARQSGTSFSAPIVAAAAAWLRAARPNLSKDQAAEVLRSSARDLGPRGWDQRFGYGLLDVGAALNEPAPSRDRDEPNDDIEWVNGRRFAEADPPLFDSRETTVSVSARLDRYEDPADVWRVVVRPGRRLEVRVQPSSGDPDLEAFRTGARTVYSRRHRIARSARPAGRTESIVVRNRGRKAVVDFIAVYIGPRARDLDAKYRLGIRAR